MFLVLLYGIKFPNSIMNGWILSSFLSVGQDIFVNQPLTTIASVFVGSAFGGLIAFFAGSR